MSSWSRFMAAAAVALVIATSASGASAQESDSVAFSYTFDSGPEDWIAGFADLPVDWDQSTFELDHGHGPLPDSLDGSGICLQGHNRSDDLFMYLKRHVGGLAPNAEYNVIVSVDLATNVPSGSVGIGGSPGSSVFVKVGASAVEPVAAEGRNQHLRMNIDKGNQANDGSNMVVVGDVAHPEVVDDEYRIKTLDNEGAPLIVQADDRGTLWLIVGTDSGFEGLTRLCYSRIIYTLSTQGDSADGSDEPPVATEATEPPSTTAPADAGPDETEPDETEPDETWGTVPTGGTAPTDSGSAAGSTAWTVGIALSMAIVVGLAAAWVFAARRRRSR